MSRTAANLGLLLAAALWGGAFIFQKDGLGELGELTFTGIRFLIGALVILPFVPFAKMPSFRARSHWAGMVAVGGALFAGSVLQQVGIGMTTASNAGFLTTLYVPMVPLIEMAVLRRLPHPIVWPAAAGCVAGAWFLSGGGFSPAVGDLWVIVSSVFWAVQIFLIGWVSAQVGQPMLVAWIQFVICGVASLACGIVVEGPTLADVTGAAWAIAYTGVLSVGGAFTLQAVCQRYTTGADAAVIVSAEAPVAALLGALVLSERLDAAQILGCLLIMASILIVQLLPVWRSGKASA